ncbi:hypothetical protein BRARA_G03098 [Brassica rapa]|uniref:RNase H type-1 domain-containing protein n=1 Tax=Brassica campestris TaxID=3711 RepID=A0A397YSW8_BRACM|nr:hypothetical protein BRARA_G03098 [Brassica rapa]
MPVIRIEPNPRRLDLCSIFTDAAWNSTTGNAGLGWIVDDLVSSSQHSATETFVSSPLMAETLAVRSAITFALSIGLESIAIFSDSQNLIKTLSRKERNLEIFGALNDIYLISSSFKTISFTFISRTLNVRADHCAKQALWALNPI